LNGAALLLRDREIPSSNLIQ